MWQKWRRKGEHLNHKYDPGGHISITQEGRVMSRVMSIAKQLIHSLNACDVVGLCERMRIQNPVSPSPVLMNMDRIL